MNQLTIDDALRGMVRATDPDTSRAAAASVLPHRETDRRRVLRELLSVFPRGLTDFDLADRSDADFLMGDVVAAARARITAAHDAKQSHHYTVHFPPHPARTGDPHYVDFDHYHRKTRATARCYVGERIGFGDCKDAQGNIVGIDASGQQSGLELHHHVIEFSLQNGVDLAALEKDYPGISNPNEVGAWVETAANFRWLCVFHHRAAGGAHTASHSDWEASQYILGLIS